MSSRNQIVAPTLLEDFESLSGFSDGSNGASSLNTDPAYVYTGTGSLKLVTSGSGGGSSSFQTTKTVSYDLSAVQRFRFRVYFAESHATLANTSSARVRFSSTSDFSKYFEYSFTTGRRPGWNEVVVNRDEFANTGGEDWANLMIRARYTVTAKDSSTVGTVYLDSLYTDGMDRAKCVLVFDDISSTNYTVAYPYMRKYGMRGSLALVSTYVGTGGKLTQAQVDEMHNAGWDVVNHTAHHYNLVTTYGTDDVGMAAEIQACKDYMLANNYTRNNEHRIFVFPQSQSNATAEGVLSNMNFIFGRSNYPRTQPNVIDGTAYLTCGHPMDMGTLTATITGKIDTAIKAGGTVILYFHILVTPETQTTEMDPAKFYAVIDYLAAHAGQIDVVPISEWYLQMQNGGGRKPANSFS